MPDKHFNKISKGLITSVFVLLIPTAICYYSLLKFHSSSKHVVHTQLIISLLGELISTMKDAETGVRGYLVTGEKSFLNPYFNAYAKVSMNYNQVRRLTQDNERQQKDLEFLNGQLIAHFKVLGLLYHVKVGNQKIPATLLKQGKVQLDNARAAVKKMQAREYELLQLRIQAESDYMTYTTILVLTIILIEIGLIYWFYKKLSLSFMQVFSLQKTLEQSHLLMKQRVEAIQKVTYRVSQGEYDIKLNEDEKDHLGILASSINKMSTSLGYSFNAAKELMQQKDDFIGIASHELKTPLTSIKAIIQIISKMKFNGEGNNTIHPLLFRANSQVKRLSQIVEDLLDVSKINEEKIELQPVTFKISEAIRDCANELMLTSASHNLIIKGDLDTTVSADKFRIDQVLINLLSNAVKYSPQADKVIATINSDKGYVKVAITDFGIGIPTDKQAFIFDRYYRVHNSSQSFSGLGLGLYISSEIIKRHRGLMCVESQNGEGSTFWFKLPLI